MKDSVELQVSGVLEGLAVGSGDTPIENATWYTAATAGDGITYEFPKGTLTGMSYVVADMLLEGKDLAVFNLILQEGEGGPAFVMKFALLNQVSARARVPLEAVNQNRWRFLREGGWLKPTVHGDVVDLRRVDRMRLLLIRKGPNPVHFCLTPFQATVDEPPLLDSLVLPKGPLLDEMGQYTLHEWPGKSRDPDEVTARLRAQLGAVSQQKLPDSFSKWGGWREHQVESSGFFRTHYDGSRWWLVDPDGYLFWSTGLDDVRFQLAAFYEGIEEALTWLPSRDGPYAMCFRERERIAFDYLRANFIRAFGPEKAFDYWAEIALGFLREFGFNTVGNWSDWEIAQGKVPYVRHMWGREFEGIPGVFRDFPDVFHPDFEAAVAEWAEMLRDTVEDPALIGYFLMNEPKWAFANQTPAEGMLYNTPQCYTREALGKFLRDRYDGNAAFKAAWGPEATLDGATAGKWAIPLTDVAKNDLADFSEVMTTRLFHTLSDACRRVDPNHLNLGIRYYTIPPRWALEGMRSFDVFSMNCYQDRVLADDMTKIYEMLGMPIIIGEWHFGALDVGLPASGIGHVPDQVGRGKAYRVYLEDAAAKPWCVGAHWFILYDQSAMGRFDGENYNIGFIDTCHRPYPSITQAARASHERLYAVASGQLEPYDDVPTYLPKLY